MTERRNPRRAYIWGRCNGVVLRTAPGSHRFRAPVVFAKHALGFDLALGSPGDGLATWIDGRCTSDPAAGSALGPVRASVLHAGAFGPSLALTDAGAQAAITTAAASPPAAGSRAGRCSPACSARRSDPMAR